MSSRSAQQIVFQDVSPGYLSSRHLPDTEIWHQPVRFKEKTKYLVYAPSGSGKTTLLSLIYGLEKKYAGQITIGNQDIRQFSRSRWATVRSEVFSVMFQGLHLLPNLSALDNILLKSQQRQNAGKAHDFAIYLAEKLSISDLLKRPCGSLSFGEQQRVALCRALSGDFVWLLLDEPFSHLDEQNTEIACQLIEQVCHERQAGLILASLGYDYFINYDKKIRL